MVLCLLKGKPVDGYDSFKLWGVFVIEDWTIICSFIICLKKENEVATEGFLTLNILHSLYKCHPLK